MRKRKLGFIKREAVTGEPEGSLPVNIRGSAMLSGITVAVAVGKDDFRMKRGSFRYNDRLKEKTYLPYKQETMRLGGTEHAFSLASSDGSVHGTLEYRFAGGNAYQRALEDQPFEYVVHVRAADPKWNRILLTFPVSPDAHYYGCGETFSEFDLKGKRVRIWVAEHQNADRIGKKLLRQKFFGKRPMHKSRFSRYESYYAQPTFFSSEGYYLHVDGNAFVAFDFRKKDRVTVELRENVPVFIGFASDFPKLSGLLTSRLGRMKPLPDWVYDGAILGIQTGTKTVEDKLEALKREDVRVAGVWSQDWCGCRRTGFGYQVMWNWEADESLYPMLPEKIREWKSRGIRFLGYINPFLAIEKPLYAYASARGYCVKDPEGNDYLVKITTFPAAMIDLTNREAYDWYKSIIKKNMIGIGMSGWMADFGEYLPVDAVLSSGEDPKKLHNRWPAIWAKLNQEAVEECGVQDEVFFFTRAGHTGTVAASRMMWTGDQHVDWSVDDGMPSVVPASLSLGLSGCTLVHSDIGGYTSIMNMTRSKELLMRWMELSAFSILMRSHEGNRPKKNLQFDADKETLQQLSRTVYYHTEIKAYLKEAEKEAVEEGLPVMRPLFYHYRSEEAYTEDSEYLLGRDVLVAPVFAELSRTRRVYLPEDDWVHIFSGRTYPPGEYVISAPMGQPPVFVRKGSEWESLFTGLLDGYLKERKNFLIPDQEEE